MITYLGHSSGSASAGGASWRPQQNAVREARQFIGGVGRCRRRHDVRGSRPVQRRPRGRGAGRRAEDAPRDRRTSAAFPRGPHPRPPSASASSLKAATSSSRQRDRLLLARETGATFGFAMFRCTSSQALPQAAATGYQPIGQVTAVGQSGTFAMGIRKPVGVVGAIAPWNAALILSARSIAAPLALATPSC